VNVYLVLITVLPVLVPQITVSPVLKEDSIQKLVPVQKENMMTILEIHIVKPVARVVLDVKDLIATVLNVPNTELEYQNVNVSMV
jgi:hypothetical protein